MKCFWLLRWMAAIPTLLGVCVVSFFLLHLLPEGPVEHRLSGFEGRVTFEQRQALRRYYGFDLPVTTRFVRWMNLLVRGDLGTSTYYREPVSEVIKRYLPTTLVLALICLILIFTVSIATGLLKAMAVGSFSDLLSTGLLLLLSVIPPFLLAVILITSGQRWFSLYGLTGNDFENLSLFSKGQDLIKHLCLPIFCYSIGALALLTFHVRNSLLDQADEPYAITAKSKGCSRFQLFYRHLLKGALVPVAAPLGRWLSLFCSGSVVIESLFELPGLGKLTFDSVNRRDFPVLLAVILLVSVLTILGNILSDGLYSSLDPRIKWSHLR